MSEPESDNPPSPMAQSGSVAELGILLTGAPRARDLPSAARCHEMVTQARAESLGPMLHSRLRDLGLLQALAADAASMLRDDLLRSQAFELWRNRADTEVLAALGRAGIQPLLLKGAALAYQVYPAPELRPRTDTDLLVPRQDLQQALGILDDLGYRRPDEAADAGYQVSMRRHQGNLTHYLDIHHRISNRELFARALPYEELIQRAVPLPKLSPFALGLSPPDALLLACMHRVGHLHGDEPERLVWLLDIHLLLNRLGDNADDFVLLARDKGMAAVCADSINATTRCFGTRLPGTLAEMAANPPRDEASRQLIAAGMIGVLWLNFRALPRTERMRYLREVAFPPLEYMRRKYPGNRLPLALLYARRAMEGVAKRLRVRRRSE